jgi:hypothetical protein
MSPRLRPVLGLLALLAAGGSSFATTFVAGPENYERLVQTLRPGDILQLKAGRYADGLRIRNLHGEAERPIVIRGPRPGRPAVFEGAPARDTVSIVNASHLEIRDLVLDGRGLEVDGVRADRRSSVLHHITLANLTIVRHGPEQQTVGIAISAPAAFIVIRDNLIIGAGTGLYLGNPDGSAAFVAGTIEGNVIVATTGYSMQIKHQGTRPPFAALPERPSRTIVRANVFAKTDSSSTGRMARPNLLLGHFPLDGPGSEDEYRVEQNLFYGNPTETLLQAEGNVSIEDNLFLNPAGDGIVIQPHRDVPRKIVVRGNFIATKGVPLRVVGVRAGFTPITAPNQIFTTAETDAVALRRWLEGVQSASPLVNALSLACRGGAPVSIVPPADPACIALAPAPTNLDAGSRAGR